MAIYPRCRALEGLLFNTNERTWGTSSYHSPQPSNGRWSGTQLRCQQKPRRIAHEPRHVCQRLKHARDERAADSHGHGHGHGSERISQAHWSAASQTGSKAQHREEVRVCHAACAAYGRDDGASTVGNRRDRRDRGSTLRRVDLKRWGNAPISYREMAFCATSSCTASRRSVPIGVDHLKKEPETDFSTPTRCRVKNVLYVHRVSDISHARYTEAHGVWAKSERGASIGIGARPEVLRAARKATPAVPAVPAASAATGGEPSGLIVLIKAAARSSPFLPSSLSASAARHCRRRRRAAAAACGTWRRCSRGLLLCTCGRRATKRSSIEEGLRDAGAGMGDECSKKAARLWAMLARAPEEGVRLAGWCENASIVDSSSTALNRRAATYIDSRRAAWAAELGVAVAYFDDHVVQDCCHARDTIHHWELVWARLSALGDTLQRSRL